MQGRRFKDKPGDRDLRLNHQIRASEVRLIGSEGENLGVVLLTEALKMARENDLDLVEIAPNVAPPVCRILDYGKFRYEQSKRGRDSRKHQRGATLHEVRMRPKIGQHDMDLKLRTADRLLLEGDRVKVTVMFRGREMTHLEIGKQLLERAAEHLKEAAVIEKQPSLEGRFMSMIMVPIPRKQAKSVADLGAEEKEVAQTEA